MLIYNILFGVCCFVYLSFIFFCYNYIKKDNYCNKKSSNNLYYEHDPLTPDTNLV